MRLGCVGCSFLLIILLGLGILVGGGLAFYTSIFALPEPLPLQNWTAADGYQAQQKIIEVLRREARESSRTDRLVFTEREINAFLARHLVDSAGIPVSPLLLKLRHGVVVIQGQTQLKSLAKGFPFNYLAGLLPASEAERPVWVVIEGVPTIGRAGFTRERETLKIEPTGFRIGHLPTGTWFLYWLLGPNLLSWPLPQVVEKISVEEGRLILITRGG
jgi:hypothetical protein